MKAEYEEIFTDRIDEPPYAMRSDIPRDELFELADDIKKNGLINPITVRPVGKRYEVVAGHRRLLAHRIAGILKIKCVVRQLNDDDAFAVMTSENLARADVNPVDESTHATRLVEMHKGDVAKVAEICNRSKEWVESRLKIGTMPDMLKDALRDGRMKIGVALLLTRITDLTDLEAVVHMALTQGATITTANYWVAQWENGLFGHATAKTLPDPTAPEGVRREVLLRCALDGKEYPAREMRSVLVWMKNVGYLEALRVHLDSIASESVSAGGEREIVTEPA